MEKHDPIQLEIFKHMFAAIPEEMGVVLRKTSYSPNIKERRDFSCALFNSEGTMIAQAAHIPVHLGSMPLSVNAAVNAFKNLSPGDVIILNDPYQGGTHLPDITLVSPVFLPSKQPGPNGAKPHLFGFVASRAHHADIGGMTPGSMPVATEIFQEGLIIPPVHLVKQGIIVKEILDIILANVRTPQERSGDIMAQLASNQRGIKRLVELVDQYGIEVVSKYMIQLVEYTERLTRLLISDIPDGEFSFTDFMDDDGISETPIPIKVSIIIHGDSATVDFTGSAPQQKGSVNAVYAITLSAVYYVFRCLLGLDVPNNSGCLAPIRVIAPQGTIVNALPPAPVAGGNVETSQRIVDVLLGALSKARSDKSTKSKFIEIPAASQGTMNNLTIGGYDPKRQESFAYYETIGGGMGAWLGKDGPSALHSHMTNTLNTPIEALEFSYPLRVLRYEIRCNSGGKGKFRGGDGIQRDIQALVDSQITLLTERRRFPPYGLAGGEPGLCGENILINEETEIDLPSKGMFKLKCGDVISIRTPGGGGYGKD